MPRSVLLIVLALVALGSSSGCSLILPEVAQQPVIRNPFPQLKRVAVAPFFNQSDESTVDGRAVAMAYFAELQSTPGFEVVPLGVVEEAIIANRVDLSGAGEARRLAQILGVDALVVGSVTDFSEYYPPRIGLRVEWYAANPGFHEIPAGYGLPWNTPEEEYIPDSLVYESQMARARAEMSGLTPDCESGCQVLPEPPAMLPGPAAEEIVPAAPAPEQSEESPFAEPREVPEAKAPSDATPAADGGKDASSGEHGAALKQSRSKRGNVQLAQAQSQLPPGAAVTAGTIGAAGASAAFAAAAPLAGEACSLPAPALAVVERPACIPFDGPVLSHTAIYRGNDADVAEALEGYVSFRNDQRFGGWKSYLRRSDDFTRFACRMHIDEMLSARGGSRKTQVVWRWPESR